MENCRAKRISGTCAAAVAAKAVSVITASIAMAGSRTARPPTLRTVSLPLILSARSGSETGVVLGRHDLQPAHVARLVRAVVGDRVVHGADVVPHQHVP